MLNHWTTREVLDAGVLTMYFSLVSASSSKDCYSELLVDTQLWLQLVISCFLTGELFHRIQLFTRGLPT